MISWTRARCAAFVLVDPFQSILQRPVADVLVIGGVDLLLGHQERPVFFGQERRRIREIQDVARFEPAIFRLAGLRAEPLRA